MRYFLPGTEICGEQLCCALTEIGFHNKEVQPRH
jgi:hypothetical protein